MGMEMEMEMDLVMCLGMDFRLEIIREMIKCRVFLIGDLKGMMTVIMITMETVIHFAMMEMEMVRIIDLKLCQCWNKQMIHLQVLENDGKIGSIIHTICGVESQRKCQGIRDSNAILEKRMGMKGERESDGRHIASIGLMMEKERKGGIHSMILSREIEKASVE